MMQREKESMMQREKYVPGRAAGAKVQKMGDAWTLVLVRDLRHPPEKVWEALTEPEHLSEWAPFDASRSMAAVGPVRLTAVGAPTPQVSETTVKRAEALRLLEFTWGGGDLRWELEPLASGTRLTLWHNINRGFITWGAAGWHICFDVLEYFLAGESIGRIVGGDAMKFEGWQRLLGEYAEQFGVESPGFSSNTSKR
ncbi:SRPBCC family protein [Citreicoccus inhibens]|uniref:SRPBCC family protein n=1 Tax=Citreicoccus inhibens TaxID=2849499 RepID=UPI001EF101DB|nr:SRPBCC family protein [Citreicoccus inhibens]